MAPRKGPMDFAVLGSTGLRQYGGMVFEEFLPRLQGRRGALAFREMRDNSSTVGAIGFTIESLIRQVTWHVEPAGDSPPARDAAEFTDGCLHDMSHTFEDFLSESLSHLTYGFAPHELVYKLRRGDTTNPKYRSKHDDGRVGWRKMPIRAQDTVDSWELDEEDSGIRGLWQSDPYQGSYRVFIPIEKMLLFRAGLNKGNPEGRSLYRNAMLDWWKLKRIQDIEAVGIERDMTGLLVMEVPQNMLTPGASEDERAVKAALELMLARLKRDEQEFALVPQELDSEGKPTGYKLKLLASGGRRQVDTNAIALRYMNSMTMSVLADFLMLGAQNVGSWALSSDKTRLFAAALGAIMDSTAAVFNRFAIPRLLRMNGVPSRYWPELQHGDIETPPLDEIGRYIVSLATAGMPIAGDKALERKVREIAHLPPPEERDGPLPGEGGALVPELPPGPQKLTLPGSPAPNPAVQTPATAPVPRADEEDDEDDA